MKRLIRKPDGTYLVEEEYIIKNDVFCLNREGWASLKQEIDSVTEGYSDFSLNLSHDTYIMLYRDATSDEVKAENRKLAKIKEQKKNRLLKRKELLMKEIEKLI